MSKLGDVWRAILALAGNRLAYFPEAHGRPIDPRVTGRGALPDFSLEQGWDRRYTVDRAQQLHRGNLLAGSILERSADHVIGPGYRVQVLSGDPGFNLEARLRWEEWADNKHLCDVRARAGFFGMLREAYVGKQRDGDSALVLRNDGTLRVVNSVEIASPVGGYYSTKEVDGVERDLNGKHLAYWIHEPSEVPTSNIRAMIHQLARTPAKDVVFLARTPLGAQQTRGITAFLGCLQLFEQIEGTLIAVAVKVQTSAKFAMVVTKKSPLPVATFGQAGRGNPLTPAWDGTVTRLELDEDIKPVQSADPNANVLELVEFLVRVCGTRFGLSLATVILDHSDHNFSNARASAIETNNCTLMQQIELVGACRDVRNHKTIEWIRNGVLGHKLRRQTEQGRKDVLANAMRHKWRLPARPLVEPLTERQADLLGLDIGSLTWEDIAGREGKTANELFRQQAREREKRAKYGLPDVRSNLTREEVETIVTESGGGKPSKKGAKQNGAGSRIAGLVE